MRPTTSSTDDSACELARKRLSLRQDGEPRDDASLDAHVAACPSCAEHARRLDELRPLFRSLREARPPERLLPELLERVAVRRTRPAPTPRIPSAVTWSSRAAAAGIGFLSILALGRLLTASPAGEEERAPARSLHALVRAGGVFTAHTDLELFPEHEFLARFAARSTDPEDRR